MSESITKELRSAAVTRGAIRIDAWDSIVVMSESKRDGIADGIDARFTRELEAKQDEVDGLKADVADLQAWLDASMPLPVDADGVPCRIGDLLEAEEHIPRKAVGYYLADESTPCVTLDFVSPSIEASELHHVAPEPPEPPDSQERIDEDAKKTSCEYFNPSTKECVSCPVNSDPTPCRLLATLDLLRRQRELDGAGERE